MNARTGYGSEGSRGDLMTHLQFSATIVVVPLRLKCNDMSWAGGSSVSSYARRHHT